MGAAFGSKTNTLQNAELVLLLITSMLLRSSDLETDRSFNNSALDEDCEELVL